MKNKIKYLLIGALTLFALNVGATIINLGITTGQPAGLANEYDRLIQQINLYNTANNPDLVIPAESSGLTTPTPGGGNFFAMNLTGWEGYLMFKWGNKDQFYYVKDVDNYTFVSTVSPGLMSARPHTDPPTLGLSHWDSWQVNQNVPDGGVSLSLLGLGLVGLISLKRK